MTTPERSVKEIMEEALDLLHGCVQHTPIKLSETNGTEYDKGYIFYQDMVVRDVLDNTPKLKALFNEALIAERQRCDEMVEVRDREWNEAISAEIKSMIAEGTVFEEMTDRIKKALTHPNNPKDTLNPHDVRVEPVIQPNTK